MQRAFNPLAIGVAAVIALLLTFAWFTVLFRDPYIADLGKSAAEMAKGPSGLVASIYQFIGFLIGAAALSWLQQKTGMTGAGPGLLLALMVWFAFIAATVFPMYAYQAFPLRMFCIVAGGYGVALAAMGLIVGLGRR